MGSFLNNVFAAVSPFPRRRDQQLYDVISTCQGYEERRYHGCTWASTTISGVYHEHARFEGFRRVGAYVTELRDKGVEISMAPPILTRVEPNNEGSGFDSMFTVSVLLSNTITNPAVSPTTTTPKVFIEHSPETTVYASSFPGIASDEKWACEARNLAYIVQNTQQMAADFYITASYDSPLQLVGTHNEVWIIKRESDQKHVSSKANKLMGTFKSQTGKLTSKYRTPLKSPHFTLLSFILIFLSQLVASFKMCSKMLVRLLAHLTSLLRFGNSAVKSVSTINDISPQKMFYLALYLNKKLWASVADVCIKTALAFVTEDSL